MLFTTSIDGLAVLQYGAGIHILGSGCQDVFTSNSLDRGKLTKWSIVCFTVLQAERFRRGIMLSQLFIR